jgi:hypothetical protein
MTEKIGYKLNPHKLKGASQSVLPYVCGAFYYTYTEDYEYFDIIKPYLDIPEPRKSLEEIQQELDDKFDKLIEKTHLEYRIGHDWLYKKRRYEDFCKKQDEDFEYARKNGQFPPKLILSMRALDCSKLSASSSLNWTNSIGNGNAGYWSIQPSFRVYLEKKPSAIVRYVAKKLLNFTWVDAK